MKTIRARYKTKQNRNMEVVWSSQAKLDLEEVCDFLANTNENASKALYWRMYEETRNLCKSPLKGAIVESTRHHKNPIRAIVVAKGRYKIFYRVETEENIILIIQVWDCRQNPCRLNLNRWCEA